MSRDSSVSSRVSTLKQNKTFTFNLFCKDFLTSVAIFCDIFLFSSNLTHLVSLLLFFVSLVRNLLVLLFSKNQLFISLIPCIYCLFVFIDFSPKFDYFWLSTLLGGSSPFMFYFFMECCYLYGVSLISFYAGT